MNKVTRDIAELLKISLDTALKVQRQMECNGVDFSECSKAAFKKEAKSALSTI